MRGIETSSTHRSGRLVQRLLEGVDAVLGLGHHLHVGLTLDQQLQSATDDAVVVGDEDPHVASIVSSIVVPSPGSEKMFRWPPDEQRALAHAREAEMGAPVGARDALEAGAVVADAQHRCARSNDSSTSTRLARACWTTLERLSCVTR